MSYLVLARKWRPQRFDELIGQETIARMLTNVLTQNRVAHAYIFSGPRGVGKTSTARILAKALNCEHGSVAEPCGACQSCKSISEGSSVDVVEIDGASNTGVDNVRDLRERIRYASSGGRYKIYIIDEAHMLSTAAFNALLKTLEEPPAHVVFVLATTDPKKIPATVMSRCQHLPFRRVSTQKIKDQLKKICGHDGITVSDSALELIARAADGSIRDALTIMDQATSFTDHVRTEDIKDLIGIADFDSLSRIASAVITGDRKDVIHIIGGIAEAGADLRSFSREFLQFLRNLMIVAIIREREALADMGDDEFAVVGRIAEMTSGEHLVLLLSEFIKAEPAIRSSLHPRAALEASLIRLSLLSHFSHIDRTLAQLRGGTPAGDIAMGGAQASPSYGPGGSEAAPTADVPPARAIKGHPPDADQCKRAFRLEETWQECLVRLGETNPPLASKLKEGSVRFSENGITIVFNGGLSVHAESVKEQATAIRSVLSDISGGQLGLSIETAGGKTAASRDIRQKMLQHPVVKEALEIFEGRIVDIIPSKQPGGEDVKKNAR